MRKNSSGSTNLSNTGSTSNLAQQDKVWQLEGIVDNELDSYLKEVISFATLHRFKTIRLLAVVSEIVSHCQFTPYNIIPDSSWFQANYQQALANSSLQIIKDLVAKNQPKPVSTPATATARTVTTTARQATAVTTNATNQATQAQETTANAISTTTNLVNQPASQQTSQQNTPTPVSATSVSPSPSTTPIATPITPRPMTAEEEIALTKTNSTPTNITNNNNSSSRSRNDDDDDDDDSSVGKLLIGAALFALFGIF